MDMRNLGEAARVTEKLADMVGDIILQLMRRQKYVEQKGLTAILNHVKEGGGTFTVHVLEDRAEDLKALLKEAHVPYAEIVHQDPETKEKSIFFVYRDSDRDKVEKVLKNFALQIDHSCHEVDLETFGELTSGKSYGSVGQLSREEVYAFREAAKNHDIRFSITSDGPLYGVVADDGGKLQDVLADMSYYLSGERGHAYQADLENYFRKLEEFDRRMEPGQSDVLYLVDAKNPRNFITMDSQGFTTHSVGSREEKLQDGSTRTVLYDARLVRHPGMDREKLRELALQLAVPVIVSKEEFPLVQEISYTGEAVLAADFVERYEGFVEGMKGAEPVIWRQPVWKPLYSREELEGYVNLPMDVVAQIREAHIPEVYCNGGDVAYPKDAGPRVDAVLEAALYRGMDEEQRKEAMEQYRAPGENGALEFMLTIEPLQMAALHKQYRLPEERLNETQREAAKRLDEKEVWVHTMDKREKDHLREQAIDKKLAQDVER